MEREREGRKVEEGRVSVGRIRRAVILNSPQPVPVWKNPCVCVCVCVCVRARARAWMDMVLSIISCSAAVVTTSLPHPVKTQRLVYYTHARTHTSASRAGAAVWTAELRICGRIHA